MFSNSRWIYLVMIVLSSVTIIYSAVCGAIELKDVSAALLALLGTFVGALFAFRLDENKENVKSEREKVESLNKALFILVRQYNAIKQIDIALSKYKTEFDRTFNLPAYQPPSYFDLKQNIESLGFLLSDHPNTLLELSIEQERFEQAIESIRLRNNFYVQEIQPELIQKQLNKKDVTLQQVKAALDERQFSSAIQYARTVYEHVSGSESSIQEMHEKLLKVSKTLYPKYNFRGFEKNA